MVRAAGRARSGRGRAIRGRWRRRSGRGLAGRAAGPKVSVVVDGGGVLHLDAVAADVRLRRLGGGSGGGRRGRAAVRRDGAAAVRWRRWGALARGRDLTVDGGGGAGAGGRRRRGGPLAGGRGSGCRSGRWRRRRWRRWRRRSGTAELRPAPGRALIVVGRRRRALREGRRAGVRGRSRRSAAGDRGLLGGAGLCSGQLATRSAGGGDRGGRPELLAGVRLHLSGCGKRCAQPAGACVSLVAGEAGTSRRTGWRCRRRCGRSWRRWGDARTSISATARRSMRGRSRSSGRRRIWRASRRRRRRSRCG